MILTLVKAYNKLVWFSYPENVLICIRIYIMQLSCCQLNVIFCTATFQGSLPDRAVNTKRAVRRATLNTRHQNFTHWTFKSMWRAYPQQMSSVNVLLSG